MNLTEALTLLKTAGFNAEISDNCIHGTIPHENFDKEKYVGKHHFKPEKRDVFLGISKYAWYVTSHIKGVRRRYRCRTEYDSQILNIFAYDENPVEAVKKFLHLWQNKTYNLPHQIVK